MLRQGVGARAPRGIAFTEHEFGQLVEQAPRERVHLLFHLLAELVAVDVATELQRQREAPDLRTFFLAQVREVLVEAAKQVDLADQHVDRKRDVEVFGQLVEARADACCVLDAFVFARGQQVRDRDR